jgi:hypothetical protein
MCENIMRNIFKLYTNQSVQARVDENGTRFFAFLNRELYEIFKEVKYKYPLN